MRTLTLSLAIVVVSLGAGANAAPSCWKREFNPSTGAKYSSAETWNRDVEAWERTEPEEVPTTAALGAAYIIYRMARSEAEALGTDKTAHCFIGCRIARYVGPETANYVGWLKEMEDVTDCHGDTHFDPEDHVATHWGLSQVTLPESCQEICVAKYP